MKIKYLFLISSLLLCTSPCFGEIKIDTEWYPFVINEKLDPNSLVNIGKIVLDAPAGKHGFCKVKDCHFYFEDGTQAKFWGINLYFSACFPEKQYAEIIANRLAFFGFNAVRLHHMDFYFEPRGIFEDIYPAEHNPQMKITSILSKTQLDKLDYLIYLLKERGIYTDMNLLVSRHFTEADGVTAAGQLRMAAKPASIFDPKLIKLQKKYAKDLLSHYNPYTRLRYCDDPSIALVEITNENSIFILDDMVMPPYYLKQIETKWNNWPKNKFKTLEAAKEALYLNIEKDYFKKMAHFLRNNCSVKAPITGIGGYRNKENIQSQESCDFIDYHSYWDHPQFPNQLWDNEDFRINNTSMLIDKKLGVIGDIIDNTPPHRTKPYTITEWNHCYPNQYAYETPILIASEAVKNSWDGLFQYAFSYGWESNPIFDGIDSYFDIIANSQQLILSSLGSFIYHKVDNPEITVENGILKIDSTNLIGTSGSIKDKFITLKNFNIKSDQNGSIILYSPENRPIEDSNKLILIAISEINNTNSGWMDGKFNWGEGPTLLKHMNVVVSLTLNKDFKVYEIDDQGKRGRKIESTYKNNILTFSTQYSNLPWFEITVE